MAVDAYTWPGDGAEVLEKVSLLFIKRQKLDTKWLEECLTSELPLVVGIRSTAAEHKLEAVVSIQES